MSKITQKQHTAIMYRVESNPRQAAGLLAHRVCGFQQRHNGPCEKISRILWMNKAGCTVSCSLPAARLSIHNKASRRRRKKNCSWRCTVIYEPAGFSGTRNTRWVVRDRSVFSAIQSLPRTAFTTRHGHLCIMHHYYSGFPVGISQTAH